jgi:dCMP deaminase
MIDYKELLRKAYETATHSHDPSTQNGALLIDDSGTIIQEDCNRFPDGVAETVERWEKPLKYKIIEHAERNVIFKSCKNQSITQGMTMVCPWAACSDCARAIIQSGIKRLITHKQAHEKSPEFWQKEIEVAFLMMKEAGVEVFMYDGPVGGPEVLHSGQKWNP